MHIGAPITTRDDKVDIVTDWPLIPQCFIPFAYTVYIFFMERTLTALLQNAMFLYLQCFIAFILLNYPMIRKMILS